MRRRRLVWLAAAAAAALVLALWWIGPATPRVRPHPSNPVPAAGGPAGAAAPRSSQPRTRAEIVGATPPGILHYADALNAPERSARDDVVLLASVIALFRRQTHELNPVGDNREITAVLTGKNRLGYAFVRPDLPAINAQGELCDRWGTPFFFHQISGTQMQVRSAGPDRKIWTDDDVAAGPED